MLLELLQRRRSIRKYSDERIPDDKMNQILQAGLLAPSSRAVYPVEFIVVRDKNVLLQLSRAKMTSSGMLAGADAAVVVIGDTERSDAWIEDCSIALTYMQLAAAELGIGNCWVQCRGRISQQKKDELIPTDKTLTGNMSTDEFLHELLGIPERYSVEAILSLGMPDQKTRPHDLPEIIPEKVHQEKY